MPTTERSSRSIPRRSKPAAPSPLGFSPAASPSRPTVRRCTLPTAAPIRSRPSICTLAKPRTPSPSGSAPPAWRSHPTASGCTCWAAPPMPCCRSISPRRTGLSRQFRSASTRCRLRSRRAVASRTLPTTPTRRSRRSICAPGLPVRRSRSAERRTASRSSLTDPKPRSSRIATTTACCWIWRPGE